MNAYELLNCRRLPGRLDVAQTAIAVPPNVFEYESLLQECVRVIHEEGKVGINLFQRRLAIGYAKATRIMEELERRGIVGPARGKEPREIINLPPAISVPQLDSADTRPTSEPFGYGPTSGSNSPAGATAVPCSQEETSAAPAFLSIPPTARVESPLSPDGGQPEPTPDNIIMLPPDGFLSKPPEEAPAPLRALRWFYEQVPLTDADQTLLWEDRGQTPDTCVALGYRSNLQANKEILLAMEKEFPPAVLEECGLWKTGDKPTDPLKPNPQFYGMSLVEKRDEHGRKVRDAAGETIIECLWNNPILIPYFDEVGDLVHLRPHKGMMRDKTPRFYVARPARAWRAAHPATAPARTPFGIVTEGEFKAGAIWQATAAAGVSAAALPGITMVKTLFGEIVEWLEESGIRQVVVAYDNEEKGNPELPGYTEEKWKRYEAQVWARFLARLLGKEGYDPRVGMLPDAWRNAKGKADWDGRLCGLVWTEIEKLKEPKPVADIWKLVAPKAQREFLAVAAAAKPIHELWQAGFFDTEEERIIKNRLERIAYEPELPIGGDTEQILARRLQRLAAKLKAQDPKHEKLPLRMRDFLSGLAKKYQNTRGGYYILKPLKEETLDKWSAEKEKANRRDDPEVARICEVAARGMPERISDFYFKAHYVLRKADGHRHRLVTIHNLHGVNTPLMAMPSSAFAQPSKFREWLLDVCTGATWSAGERELNKLQADFAREVSFKDVIEVPLRGYHEPSKIWFFEDVAFGPGGVEFLPDPKTGIFWIRLNKEGGLAQGYTFPRDSQGRPRDREGEVFRQGVPLLHPGKPDREDMAGWFSAIAQKSFETVGDYGGYMGLGMILAYAAAPEVFREWSCFPGLWLHGEQGQGKSSFARWLLRIWGYNKDKGLPLPADERTGTLTAPAVAGALGQQGNLPLWLDEYQTTTPGWVRAILKNIYDRAEGAKRDFGQNPREFLTGVIVSGVATSSDSQTKSRYAHVQLSSKRRLVDHYQWFQQESREFYQLGRYLMRHRERYVELFQPQLKAWMEAPGLAGVDDRMRMVHATAYAGMHALAELLECGDLALRCKEYRTWLMEHCRKGEGEVHDQIGVNQFWRLLINANESDAFGMTPSDLRNLFKVEVDGAAAQISEQQLKWGEQTARYKWESLLLYLRPGPVLDMLRKYYRSMGKDMPLDQSDLRSQMKTRPYWVEAQTDEGHRKRFGDKSKSPSTCWCIRLDRHELGLQVMPDEEFEKSWHVASDLQGDFVASAEWIDPRRGDLFTLVEAIVSKELDV